MDVVNRVDWELTEQHRAITDEVVREYFKENRDLGSFQEVFRANGYRGSTDIVLNSAIDRLCEFFSTNYADFYYQAIERRASVNCDTKVILREAFNSFMRDALCKGSEPNAILVDKLYDFLLSDAVHG